MRWCCLKRFGLKALQASQALQGCGRFVEVPSAAAGGPWRPLEAPGWRPSESPFFCVLVFRFSGRAWDPERP